MSDHHLDVTGALDAVGAAAAVEAAQPGPGGPHRLLSRIIALRHELGKFGAVGIFAYAADVTTYNLLLKVLQVETLTAAALATVVGSTVAFAGNRFWTWRHRARSGLHREYPLYFAVNLVGLVIALACVGLSHYGLGSIWPAMRGILADNVAKNVVGMAFGTVFRFWAYRRFVFPDHHSGPT